MERRGGWSRSSGVQLGARHVVESVRYAALVEARFGALVLVN